MQTEAYRPGLAKNPQLVRLLKEFQANPRSLSFVALAEQYRAQGLPEQAQEICVEGLRFHPQLSSGLMVLARCYFDLRKFADALEITEELLKQNAENVRAHKLRAEIFIRLGQRKAAMTSLSRVLWLFPQDEEARRGLEELRDLDREPKSLQPTHRVDARAARSSIADFRVGSLREGLEVQAQDQIEEISEEPLIATRTIAELYLRQGLRDKALLVLRKILKENPANAWARETLQELRSNGIVAPAAAKNASQNEVLERKARYLERLLAQVQVLRKA